MDPSLSTIYIFAVFIYGQPKSERFTVVAQSDEQAQIAVDDYLAQHIGGFAELIDVR